MKASELPTPDERAAEYVDSVFMTQRVRYDGHLSARIEGVYGTYRTSAAIGTGADWCTCPSDEYPCKHIRALRKTWRVNPDSFFDLGAFLRDLSQQPKAALLAALKAILLADPGYLGTLGIAGFETDDDDERPDSVKQIPEGKPAPPFTARQGQYLAFIYQYQRIHRKAPAEAEVQQYFRVSPPAVHQMLVTLQTKGLIAREPGKARSIRLLVSPADLPELP